MLRGVVPDIQGVFFKLPVQTACQTACPGVSQASTHKLCMTSSSSVAGHPTPPTHPPTCGAAQGLHAGQAAHDGIPLGHLAGAQRQAGRDDGGQALGDGSHSQRHSHLPACGGRADKEQGKRSDPQTQRALMRPSLPCCLRPAACIPLPAPPGQPAPSTNPRTHLEVEGCL